jgi:hypothetical protein
MRPLVILVPWVLLAAGAGCNGSDDAPELPANRPVMPADRTDELERPRPPVLLVRLHVWALEVPAGLASRSEDLWSYLNEEPLGPTRQASLGRNGLRVGTAPADAWGELAPLLRQMTGSGIRRSQLAALPGNPLQYALKEDQPPRTIFTSHDDRTLTGADYPPGNYVLMLTATVDVQNPSFVVVTGSPQIRCEPGLPRYVREGATYRVVVRPERFTFDHLRFQLSVSENDIIVIGPGTQSRRATSIGRSFLVRRREGMDFETVLVIRPVLSTARP